MNDNNEQHPAAEHEELTRLVGLLRTHGNWIAGGLVVVLLAVAIPNLVRIHRERAVRRASRKLFSAQSVPDLEAVVEQYGSTPMAPLASLKLAKTYFDAGNFERALRQYEALKETYPKHPMAAAADLGRAQCLEAKGEFEKALEVFAAFPANHPDHFLVSQALFGRARCLAQLGRLHEAKAVLEDFRESRPESVWSLRADEQIDRVQKAIDTGRPLYAPPPAPVEVPAAAGPALPFTLPSEATIPMVESGKAQDVTNGTAPSAETTSNPQDVAAP